MAKELYFRMTTDQLYDQAFQARCDGDYSQARQLIMRLLADCPGHTDGRWQLGLIQGFEGDFDGSLETLEQVVRLNPTHTKARYDLAMTQMMLGMMDEACANFRLVLAHDPTHEDAARQVVYCP